MNRLESLAPDVAERLRQASPDKQRAAALAACQFAIAKADVRHAGIEDACNGLRKGDGLSTAQLSEIESLAASLDNEYFDLQEAAEEGRANTEDYLRKFAQARAVSALLFASKSDSLEASTEAVYEAAAAVEDKERLFATIESALR
jgi:KaiC/GvpD/RAD55 family RecA-like ATPase